MCFHTHTHIHTHMCMHMCSPAFTNACIQTYVHTHTAPAHMYTCVHAHKSMHIYKHTPAGTHVRTCTHSLPPHSTRPYTDVQSSTPDHTQEPSRGWAHAPGASVSSGMPMVLLRDAQAPRRCPHGHPQEQPLCEKPQDPIVGSEGLSLTGSPQILGWV